MHLLCEFSDPSAVDSDSPSVEQRADRLVAVGVPIALASRPAIESTLSRSNRRSDGIAIVLVTATSLTGDAISRSTAGPESRACVAQQ